MKRFQAKQRNQRTFKPCALIITNTSRRALNGRDARWPEDWSSWHELQIKPQTVLNTPFGDIDSRVIDLPVEAKQAAPLHAGFLFVGANGHTIPAERLMLSPHMLLSEDSEKLIEAAKLLGLGERLTPADLVPLALQWARNLGVPLALSTSSFRHVWSSGLYPLERAVSQGEDGNLTLWHGEDDYGYRVELRDTVNGTVFFPHFAWRPRSGEVVIYDRPIELETFFACAAESADATFYHSGSGLLRFHSVLPLIAVLEDLKKRSGVDFNRELRLDMNYQFQTLASLAEVEIIAETSAGLFQTELLSQDSKLPVRIPAIFSLVPRFGIVGVRGDDQKIVASRGPTRALELSLLRHSGFAAILIAECLAYAVEGGTLAGEPLKNEKAFRAHLSARIDDFTRRKYNAQGLSGKVKAYLHQITADIIRIPQSDFRSILETGSEQLTIFVFKGELLARIMLTELRSYLAVIPVKELLKEKSPWWHSLLTFSRSEDDGWESAEERESRPAGKEGLWAFLSEMAAQGVKVTLDRRKIEQLGDEGFDAKLTVHDHSLKQDWFSLSPEVFFNGRAVDLSEANILPGERLMEYKGRLYCFDRRTLPKIQALSAFWDRVLATKGDGLSAGKGDFYPVPKNSTLELLQLRRSGIPVVGGPDWQRITEYFDELEKSPAPLALPHTLKGTPLPHQMDGVRWLRDLYELRLGALLADEMGLGKTLQALLLLEMLRAKSELGRCLVIVPTSLVYNWKSEAARFTPELPIHDFSRDKDLWPEEGVIIASYGLLTEYPEVFESEKWNVVIFDEAHFLKNIGAERTKVARKLKAAFKVCMTGTPLENNFEEFYSIVDLALPGALGPFRLFTRHISQFSDLGSQAFRDWTQSLRQILAPVILRRLKKDVNLNLPAKAETVLTLEMAREQMLVYKKTAIAMNDQIKALIAQGQTGADISVLLSLMRMRQICSDPKQVDAGYLGMAPKFPALIEDIEQVLAQGESALVFVQFISSMNRILQELERRGIRALRMAGATPRKEREKILKVFDASETPLILVMTLKTGGVGLNLTRANHVFHFEPWWNPAAENQGTDRVHRMGQNRAVSVRRLIMKDTLEERMQAMKEVKLLQFNALFDAENSGDFTSAKLDLAVFERLLSHGE